MRTRRLAGGNPSPMAAVSHQVACSANDRLTRAAGSGGGSKKYRLRESSSVLPDDVANADCNADTGNDDHVHSPPLLLASI